MILVFFNDEYADINVPTLRMVCSIVHFGEIFVKGKNVKMSLLLIT
jgi:hypothetical protein